jgi:hypothetical protein
MIMPPEKARKYVKEGEEMAAAAERKRLDEKVNSWREVSFVHVIVVDGYSLVVYQYYNGK